ncbi:unnamed protein product [Scytosiphon promiscuus]
MWKDRKGRTMRPPECRSAGRRGVTHTTAEDGGAPSLACHHRTKRWSLRTAMVLLLAVCGKGRGAGSEGDDRQRHHGADEFDDLRRRKSPRLAPEDWQKEGFAFADRRQAEFEALRVDKMKSPVELESIHVANVSAADFREKYEALHVPVVIDGIPETEMWGAAEWTIPVLAQKYPRMNVMVGSEKGDRRILLTMEEFERYARTNKDDMPMYVFDWAVYDDGVGKEAMAGYRVPSVFEEDLFALVEEHDQYPAHRWLLVGPKRSGSMCHNDPLGTSAWNTLLSGRKLWFLAPPHLEDAVLATRDTIVARWFLEAVPQLQARYGDEIIMHVQHPGETMFVPGFWMHAVLNLDDATAVTQNFVSSHNFPEAWEYTSLYLPRFAGEWLRELSLSGKHQHLAALAMRIDANARKGPASVPAYYYDDDDDDDDEDIEYDGDDDIDEVMDGEDHGQGRHVSHGEGEL